MATRPHFMAACNTTAFCDHQTEPLTFHIEPDYVICAGYNEIMSSSNEHEIKVYRKVGKFDLLKQTSHHFITITNQPTNHSNPPTTHRLTKPFQESFSACATLQFYLSV